MKYDGSILDIASIKVGHYTDLKAQTGCTVVLCENGAVGGVDVRGAAPATRETDLLRGFNLVEQVNAVLLTGGSAFGLAAADGVMAYLERAGKGFDSGFAHVPIVPAAAIYDLGMGSATIRPDAAAGEAACVNASSSAFEQGLVGAGTGATVGKLLGLTHASRGGLGSASIKLISGIVVAALIVVNAAGDVYDPKTGSILAGAKGAKGEFLNCFDALIGGASPQAVVGTNTTIGVIATDAKLNREQANRLATIAHNGLAVSIRPVHTQFDGDALFALSTGEKEIGELLTLFAAAVEVTARAVANAVGYHD